MVAVKEWERSGSIVRLPSLPLTPEAQVCSIAIDRDKTKQPHCLVSCHFCS